MFSQDWVDHMREVMEHGNIGDTYDVFRIRIEPDSPTLSMHGSTYVKTHNGYTHTSYENRHLIV